MLETQHCLNISFNSVMQLHVLPYRFYNNTLCSTSFEEELLILSLPANRTSHLSVHT